MYGSLLRLVVATPDPPRSWLANRLADGAFHGLGSYRRNVLANLEQVAAGTGTSLDPHRTAVKVFRTAGRNFVDLGQLPRATMPDYGQSVRVIQGDWSTLESSHAAGRGTIVVSAHLGPFEQIPAILASRGIQPKVLTTRTTGHRMFALSTRLRRAHGVTVEEVSQTALRDLIRHLGQGGCVGLLGDCDFTGTGDEVDFFGRTTTLPTVAVRLARMTGAPVIPTFVRRTGGYIDLSIGNAIAVGRSSDRDRDLRLGLAEVTGQVERAIARSPDQWVLFQRAWPR